MNGPKKIRLFELLLYHRSIYDSATSISQDMVFYIVENKYKFSIAVTSLTYSFMQAAIFFYRVVTDPDIDYIFNYSPMLIFCYFNICSLMQVFIKYRYMRNSSDFIKEHFWSPNFACAEAKLEIEARVGILKKLMLFISTMSFAIGFPCLPFTGIKYSEDLFPFVEFLDHINFPSHLKTTLAIANYIVAFPNYYFMTIYGVVICFYASNSIVQAILIKWNLINLTDNLVIDEDNILQDDQKQMMMEYKLKKCIKQHRILCEFIQQAQGFVYYTALWHLAGAVTLLASLSYALAFREQRLNNMLILITELTVVSSSTFFYCFMADLILQQMEDIPDATTETKWYYLNTKNRKLFLTFITNLRNKHQLVLGGIFDANLDLCVYIFKKAYAVVSVLGAMK